MIPPFNLPLLAVDLASWFTGFATLAAVVVALSGWRLNDWLRRPRLKITFEHAEPWCRSTTWADDRQAYWVRVRVKNKGIHPARACMGRLTEVRTGEQLRHDIDPTQLRWAGVPTVLGFQPRHLAKEEHEFLDVFRIVQDESPIKIGTFPRHDVGFTTELNANVEYRMKIVVIADNADPAQAILTVKYNGDFDALPDSLAVSLAA